MVTGWSRRNSTGRPWISIRLSNRPGTNLERTTSWSKFGNIDLGLNGKVKEFKDGKAEEGWNEK